MLHIQQQHTGGIGIITGMNAGELVVDEVLGQHNLADTLKVLRLVFLHPQQLGRGESGKGNVCRQLGQLLLANDIVEICNLLIGAAIIPQDGRPNHLVIFIQDNQAVHLTAAANASHIGGRNILRQLLRSISFP